MGRYIRIVYDILCGLNLHDTGNYPDSWVGFWTYDGFQRFLASFLSRHWCMLVRYVGRFYNRDAFCKVHVQKNCQIIGQKVQNSESF